MSRTKEIKQLIEEGKKQGWQVTHTPGCHYKWVHPDGGLMFTSLTPSDHRAFKNIRRDMMKKKTGKSA